MASLNVVFVARPSCLLGCEGPSNPTGLVLEWYRLFYRCSFYHFGSLVWRDALFDRGDDICGLIRIFCFKVISLLLIFTVYDELLIQYVSNRFVSNRFLARLGVESHLVVGRMSSRQLASNNIAEMHCRCLAATVGQGLAV